MATKSLDVVTLSAPSGNISKGVDETFVMSQSYTLTGNGGSPTVNLTWQYDQGSSTWIDIPTSGATGLVADSGAENSATVGTTYNRTITCKSIGEYVIRAKAVDVTTPVTKYSTNTPTITVTVGKTPLTSTVNIATSFTSALSRGVTEALTSTANIVSLITGILTRAKFLISTSVITSSITSSLSRGIKGVLTSTSNIATSITGNLSRGITKVLISTSNIAISVSSALSRGVTQTLTSTANIATSIVANLTKTGGEVINLLSTAVITSFTTGSLSAIYPCVSRHVSKDIQNFKSWLGYKMHPILKKRH